MILRKIISILLISVLLIGPMTVYAEPSNWATEFIEEATNDNLIPENLMSDYQNNIKRYEYVLLALKVLDQNNISVEITENNPFTDIGNHPYKNEIIRAYNAGIVGGYEDNTFRPDNEIKREEVAALVYNLVKAINKNIELPISRSNYSDTNKISNWALPYVEFNYVKFILSGTGKINGLDTIDPLGKTTREQSITLLYKVSVNDDLLAKFGYTNEQASTVNVDPSTLNTAAKNIGTGVMDTLFEISKKEDVRVSEVFPITVRLEYENGNRLSVVNDGYNEQIMILVLDSEIGTLSEDLETIAEEVFNGLDLKTTFDSYLAQYTKDGQITVYQENYMDGYFYCVSKEIESKDAMDFMYSKKIGGAK